MGENGLHLIPDNLQVELLSYREQVNRAYWRIGDISNGLYWQAVSAGNIITKGEINEAISFLTGLSIRTVRQYADVAEFYPANVRDKFPLLLHSHFEYAKTFGQDWAEVLNMANEIAVNTGFAPSISLLESKLKELPREVEKEDGSVVYDEKVLLKGSLSIMTSDLQTLQTRIGPLSNGLQFELQGLIIAYTDWQTKALKELSPELFEVGSEVQTEELVQEVQV